MRGLSPGAAGGSTRRRLVPPSRRWHELKILQEAITLAVFVPFAWLYVKEPVRLNCLWAALCLCGAVVFMFRR